MTALIKAEMRMEVMNGTLRVYECVNGRRHGVNVHESEQGQTEEHSGVCRILNPATSLTLCSVASVCSL